VYRLLALDLDGTLLRSDQTIDDRDVAAIRALQDAGVVVTIVTGRLRSGATAAARRCGIEGAIACVEGSHIVDLGTGATLAHHPIDGEIAGGLRDAFAAAGLAGFVFDADGIHHDTAGEKFARYITTWSPNLRVVEDAAAWQCTPLAAVAIGEPDAAAAMHDELLRDRPGDLFSVRFPVHAFPGAHAVLCRAAGPSKGTALAELCRAAGCATSDAVVVGDWVNDVPMFDVAGRSFAMSTSPDDVRARATDVLPTAQGEGGGIAEAIRRAWG
jgi:Cof subfamily protein (haloacid dehalogenase superfamily)